MYVCTECVCRATAVFCMFSLLVVFLATEPNLFEGVFGKHGDCGGGISPQRGKKKNNNTEVQTIGVGFTLLPLSPFLLPTPLLCEGAREREKERETSMIEVSLRNKKEREMCGGHSRAVEGRGGVRLYFRLMLAGLF